MSKELAKGSLSLERMRQNQTILGGREVIKVAI